ncbi:MAG: glycosyltransferase family A protein [Caldilineaceae bacterium]
MTKRAKIHAVIVNHNTSAYVELALRSLHKRHADDLDLAITIVDNASTDDTSSLLAYADDRGIPVRQSGFTTDTASNSHGEVLRQFVLDHPDCDDYLFLDADICFLEDDTIHAMLAELTTAEDAFAVGVRQTWDGQDEIPADIHQAIYYNRLHPCCAGAEHAALPPGDRRDRLHRRQILLGRRRKVPRHLRVNDTGDEDPRPAPLDLAENGLSLLQRLLRRSLDGK